MGAEGSRGSKTNIESRSQIIFHQSTDSAKEHHDAPLWISRTKELRTLQLKVIPYDMGGYAAVRNWGLERPIIPK